MTPNAVSCRNTVMERKNPSGMVHAFILDGFRSFRTDKEVRKDR